MTVPLPRPLRIAAFWTMIAALNGFAVLPFLRTDYLIMDPAEAIYQVKALRAGMVPYRDFFTHHFVGYALPLALVDAIVPLNGATLRLTALLYHLVFVAGMWAALRIGWGPKSGVRGALVASTVGWFPYWGGKIFGIQSFITPLLAVFLALLVRGLVKPSPRTAALCGLTAGILAIMDQRCVPFVVLLVPVCWVLPRHERRAGFFSAAAAAALTPVSALLVLAAHGALGDFLQQTLLYSTSLRNEAKGILPLEAASRLTGIALESSMEILAVSALGAFVLIRNETRPGFRVTMFGFFGLSLLAVLLGGRPHPNYLLFLAPVLVLFVAVLPRLAERPLPRRLAATGVLVLCLLYALHPLVFTYHSGRFFEESADETIEAVAGFIRRHPDARAEGVQVWGYAPQIYLRSGTFSAFRDMGLLSVAGSDLSSLEREGQGIEPGMEREFQSMFDTSPPGIFVFYQGHSNGRPEYATENRWRKRLNPAFPSWDIYSVKHLEYLRRIVDDQYELVARYEGEFDSAEVFLRKEFARMLRKEGKPAQKRLIER